MTTPPLPGYGPRRRGEIWTVRAPMGPEFSVIVADPDWLAAKRPMIAAFQVIPRAERLTELALLSMDLSNGRVVAAYKIVTPLRERFAALEGCLTGSDLEMFVELISHRWDV